MTTDGAGSAPAAILERLRKTFASGRTRDIAWRRGQLEALRRLCVEGEPRIVAALEADFAKPAFETKVTETHALVWEIDHALALVARPARERSVGVVAGRGASRAGAARRRAHHRAVELPGPAAALAADRRARGGQLRGAQTLGADAAHRRYAGRAGAALSRQRRDRPRRRRRRGFDRAARRALRPHLLHRRRAGRPRRHGSGGKTPDPGGAGTRRQEPLRRRGRYGPHHRG